MKLIIVDMDGTLFDTKDVNFHAYRQALAEHGFGLDYEYYCSFCNGRHYTQFLPQITTGDKQILSAIHARKKTLYPQFLAKARPNEGLVDILRALRGTYRTALVTTASKTNCYDILNHFQLAELFDLVLTQDDITRSKPDPEGFQKAMAHFGVTAEDTIIFEDSDVGLEAAKQTGASYYRTFGFN